MITSIRNIKLNFFQLFLGAANDGFLREYVSIDDYDGAELHQVPLRYFHLSSGDLAEAPFETYPVISVQDYMPQAVDNWNNWPQPRISRFRDTDNDGKFDAASKIPKATRLTCRYDVSVAAKDEKTFTDITDWFYRNFGFGNDTVFMFNALEIDGLPYGDIVDYRFVQITDNPRRDGIFENVYVFELSLWADIKRETDYAELSTEIQVQFNQSLTDPTFNTFGLPNTVFTDPGVSNIPVGVSVN